MNILLLGKSGLLGQHLTIEADTPTHKELDIKKKIDDKWRDKYDLVIDCVGYTDVAGAEIERRQCFNVNVSGTLNLLDTFPTTPFVFISSEYARNPVNFYGLTKMLAEQLVMTHPNYLIIRTLFKPDPWPYEYAFMDQMTQGSYVTKIAPKIEQAIKEWDRKSKLIYVGSGGRKTMYELAKQTRPDVKPNKVSDIITVKLPRDYQ